MRIFRNIAAAILACEALLIVVTAPIILRRSGRIEGNLLELVVAQLLGAAFYGFAAWQVYRERPRTAAWIVSLSSALVLPGLLRIPASTPLLYLLARIASNQWNKPAQAAGKDEENAPTDPQPASPPQAEGSAALETVVGLIVAFANGAILRMLPAWLLPAVPADGRDWGWISFMLGLTLCTFFHELGHALAGRVMGFRMSRFAVYPFDYTRTSNHRRFRVNFKLPAAGLYLGFPKSTENLKTRHAIMTAFGPIGGIIFSAVCWAVLMLAGGHITGIAFATLYTAMSFGLFTNVFNLMPLKSGGLKLDGRVLWDTFFDRPAAEATIAILGCNTSMQSDLRPRDWPPDWVTHLRRLHADPLALALFSYSAEDRLTTSPNDPDARKDLELASASFSHLTEKLKHEPKASAAFEFHRCWIRSRYFGEKVSPNFERAKSDEETSPFEILRLQAALTALDGDSPAAVELLAQAETSLAANVKHGIDATDLDALRAFREELLTNPAIAPDAVGVAEGDHGDARG